MKIIRKCKINCLSLLCTSGLEYVKHKQKFIMKKLLVLITGVLLSVSSYGQSEFDYKPIHPTIGGLSGFTVGNSLSINYGGWIDFGRIGIEFRQGAQASNENPTNFINGVTAGGNPRSNAVAEYYTAGSSFTNLGVFIVPFVLDKNETINVFVSAGAQFVEDITTSGIKKSQKPYAGFGVDFNFGYDNRAVIRTEVQFSKISTIGMGLGYKF